MFFPPFAHLCQSVFKPVYEFMRRWNNKINKIYFNFAHSNVTLLFSAQSLSFFIISSTNLKPPSTSQNVIKRNDFVHTETTKIHNRMNVYLIF